MIVAPAGFRGRTLKWPGTAADAKAATGIDWQSLYGFQETSGNVLDLIDANNLVATSTPTYRAAAAGRFGVSYDSASDAHLADVNDLGVTSGIYALVCDIAVTAVSIGLVGRKNNPFSQGACIFLVVPASGYTRADIKDDTGHSAVVNPLFSITKSVYTLGRALHQLQIDRAAALARYRISWRSGSIETSASIAGFSTLTGATQSFGVGALPGLSSATMKALWAGVAKGVQCEGATVLRGNARGLGFE